MNKKLLIAILLNVIVLSIFSQGNFKSAYIIKQNNDTVFGLVNDQQMRLNMNTCLFKKDSNSVVNEFKPKDIQGYRFLNGKSFVSKSFVKDNDTLIFFVDCILKGKANLYYLTLDSKDYYLIEKGNELPLFLSNDEILKVRRNSKFLVKSNNYIRLLKASFIDCPEVLPLVDKTKYNSNSIISIVKKYHEYTSSEYVQYDKNSKKDIYKFGVVLSYQYHQIFMRANDDFQNKYYIKYIGKSVFPNLGFGVSYSNLWMNEHFTVNFISQIGKTDVSISSKDQKNKWFQNDLTYNAINWRNSFGVQYSFFIGKKIFPFVELGGIHYKNFNLGYDYEYDPSCSPLVFSFSMGGYLGVGFTYNKNLSLNFEYELLNEHGGYSYLTVLSLGVGYWF